MRDLLISALLICNSCTVALPRIDEPLPGDASVDQPRPPDSRERDRELLDGPADGDLGGESPPCMPQDAPEARFTVQAPSCALLAVQADAAGSIPSSCGRSVQDFRWRLYDGDPSSGRMLLEIEGPGGQSVQGSPLGGGTYERPQLWLIDPQIADGRVARYSVDTTDKANQVFQHNLTIEEGKPYTVALSAHSNTGHDLNVVVREHAEPYTEFGPRPLFDLQTDWRRFTFTFIASVPTTVETDSRLQIIIAGSGDPGDVYWLDNVVLRNAAGAVTDNALQNPGFEDSTLDPWSHWVPGMSSLEAVSLVDSLPARYSVELTVTDDALQSSAPQLESFDMPSCP